MSKSPPPNVSVFTPFFRRFTDERARDVDDTRALLTKMRAQHQASAYAADGALAEVTARIYSEMDYLQPPVDEAFWVAIYQMLAMETAIFDCPSDVTVSHLSLKEQVDLRRFLRAKEHFLANEEKVIALLKECLILIFGTTAAELPQTVDPSPFTIPLIYTLPEPRKLIDQLYGTLWESKYVDFGLFVEVSRQMYLNLCTVSEIVDPYEPKRPFKHASKSEAPLHELVDRYLAKTPFHDFFLTTVPLRFTYEERFSHMHIVGGSGAGKTTLLQNLILHDLTSKDPPALVIVDGQGDLIGKLSRLALFQEWPLEDHLVVITPKDLEYPPALNIFDVNRGRMGQYDAFTKEQVVAGVIQTFDYLFTGLLGADLTAKQSVFFRYVARLMLALPESLGRNATILDMIKLMDDPEPYREAVRSLPEIQRQFFERDFPSKTFTQTKEQIRYRLQAILENPTIARLFTCPTTKIDLFAELNAGSIILVDTAKDFLKGASANFGRIFISLVLQAVLERAAIPEAERKPAFLIVDEAASYFDSNIDDLLTEARKYKLGCVFAHQFLDQCTSSLRASFAANTAIKMAGGVSTADARALAPELRTTADFVLSQPRLHFACHIRNVTPQAVSIPIPVRRLEEQPRLSSEDYERALAYNRSRVSLPKAAPDAGPSKPDREEAPRTKGKPESPPSPPPPDPGTAASTEW
ncbi:MAG TPA: hypothetical protein VKU00_13730 [Chthonomonadaceae bacterium]|nr:hypothetical protein [Chthonomonadaceae bacterium]